jgi:hypothetical protein
VPVGSGRGIHSGTGQQREAVLRQSLHQPQLPQRTRAIQCLGEHSPTQPPQLGLVAGVGQRGVTDVEGDVEVRIVDPGRSALGQRDERKPLAIAGHQVQSRDDLLHELLVGGRRTLAHDRGGNVHMRGAVLEVQERCIEPGEAVRGGHATILPASRTATLV